MTKRRNRIGILSLGVAAAGFLLVTLQPWIPLDRLMLFSGLSLKRLLTSFFDASLVGALADWFAVTALFTNPLGVKLPHTDILAKNKDSIADAVPRFLAGFLSEEKISTELARVDFGAKIAELLGRPDVREEIHGFLRDRLVSLLPDGDSPREEGENRFSILVDRVFSFLAEKTDPAAILVGLIQWARRENLHETVISRAAELLRKTVDGSRDRLVSILTPMIKRNSGWQGLFVGRRVVERLIDGIKEELGRIQGEPDHEIRRLLSSSFASYAAKLSGEGPGQTGERARLGLKLREVLTDKSLRSHFARFLEVILERLRNDLSRPDSLTLQGVERLEQEIQARLSDDDGLRLRFNREISRLITAFITRSRLIEGVSGYLASLLRATNEREFVNRIEDAVWNDLQYIRVNGAVVGGLVGLVLALVSAFLP